ncbi:peptidase [Sphaerisporangium melleum]|uniref:Peptidase n=1 Tax=Sphaerisporangium melleum TaxID=321316 RepID=A0A917RJL8_9ACTN|nr:prolyl oligopeptidase family serine peptidase [Sphaerisporangium melleum]GGL11436.1 peptidase [Sphaerisporangium melleum]GII71732.1 peptidase [Sphaerisporangium melleum]
MTISSLPRQLARTRRFTLGGPRHVTVSPDGGTVFFLRTRAGDDPVSCLWALDRATGEERLLVDPLTLRAGAPERLSPEERTRRERARELSSGIVAYAADAACELLAFTLSGAVWTVRPADGAPRRLPAAEPAVDPRPDPTGRRVAYVSGGALRVVDAIGAGPAQAGGAGGPGAEHAADRVVAAPDGPEVTFGLAEHVAAESMGRQRGYWWAPDGRGLLVARVDDAPVGRWYVADPMDPSRPPAVLRYPAAGTANAEVSLWLARLDDEHGTWALTPVGWDTGEFEYLTAAGWDECGPYAAVQSRDQRHVRVLAIDPVTGATEMQAEQRDEAWVELVPGLPARTAKGVLVTSADTGDTRRLVVGGHPVTPPGLQLHAVEAVDGETVLFTAADDPTQSHLWAYDPVSGLRRVSEEPGVHTGTRRGGTTVLSSRTLDRPGSRTVVLRDAAGAEIGKAASAPVEIASRAEPPVLDPRVEMLALGPRELRAALFLPSWHREQDGPLPVLMDPYGGPAMRKVTAERAWWTYVSQWFAEQGFAVLAVDGRGTPGRGPAWERAIHLDIAGPVLEDQVAGLHEAARRFPFLDLGRVAVRGWSFGGFLAALAVLRRPDVFHAAVAGAPVTDQRLYDTHWRERHLGHPDRNPEAYDRCSPIREAASLTRPLLLVHGLADDNVVAAHTLRFSAALLAAGRPHEVLPLPRATHLPSDEAVAVNLLLHQLDFLRRSLGLTGRAPDGLTGPAAAP